MPAPVAPTPGVVPPQLVQLLVEDQLRRQAAAPVPGGAPPLAPMATAAERALPPMLNMPASAFFTPQNVQPVRQAQQRAQTVSKGAADFIQALKGNVGADLVTQDMRDRGFIGADKLGELVPPGTPSPGVWPQQLTEEALEYVRNPQQPQDVQMQAEQAAREAYQQRVKASEAAKRLYTGGGRKELREKAFTYNPDTVPPALQAKVDSGEVITGAALPDWLLKEAPGARELYWYTKELSPDMLQLMRTLVPAKPAKPTKPAEKKVKE